MPDRDEDLGPTLAETARRRADLRDALVDVEQAISRPAVGREPDWAKEVVLRLEGLAHAIDEHIEITERTEGLYDEISAKAPHLATKMDRLREEHPALREAPRRSSPGSRPPSSAGRGRSTRRGTTFSGSSDSSCATASSAPISFGRRTTSTSAGSSSSARRRLG